VLFQDAANDGHAQLLACLKAEESTGGGAGDEDWNTGNVFSRPIFRSNFTSATGQVVQQALSMHFLL